MAMLILEPEFDQAIRADRQARGIDQHDEVWDGLYVMSPLADDEHQELVGELCSIFVEIYRRRSGAKVRPGVNVSDRNRGWEQNFRVPDVLVFLPGTKAINRGTHWQGGPDFAVEIENEGGRDRDKLDFYAKVGVRELLLVSRDPWALVLFRLKRAKLRAVGTSTLEQPDALRSDVVPLTFRLVANNARPRIEVTHRDDGRQWLV
jgi:Uma2 family endonuclease